MADVTPVVEYFKEGKYQACADLALHLLKKPDLTNFEQATCYAHLTWSQYLLKDFGSCVESGILAAHLSEECGELDLMGKSLLAVANAHFHRGMPSEAVAVLLRASRHIGAFRDENFRLEGKILLNLGVYLKALARYDESLEYLDRARAWWQGKNDSFAELARSYSCWIYLTQGNLKAAERLLPFGDSYVRSHPEDNDVATQHLIDRALYAMAIGEPGQAAARAWECIGRSAQHMDARSDALFVIARLALQQQRPDAACSFATLSLWAADRAARPDRVGRVRQFLEQLQVNYPDAVLKAMADLIGQPPN